MFRCGHCSKEIPFGEAFLTQDLAVNTVGFCSPACQDTWYHTMLSAPPSSGPSRKSATPLRDQTFFSPFPEELMALDDSGGGRA
jgi:hypothetical protein